MCDSFFFQNIGALRLRWKYGRYPLLTSKPIYNVGKVGADVLVSRAFARNIDEYIIEAAREMAAALEME